MSALDKYKTDWLIVRNQNSAHSYGEILEFKIQKLTRNFNSPRGGLSWERVDGNTVITRISAASSQQQDGACGFDWLLAVFNIMLYHALKCILLYLLYIRYISLENIFCYVSFAVRYLLWWLTGIKGKRKANYVVPNNRLIKANTVVVLGKVLGILHITKWYNRKDFRGTERYPTTSQHNTQPAMIY